jgi:photosystem II stability/assembly factor-like uncharacterized protein
VRGRGRLQGLLLAAAACVALEAGEQPKREAVVTSLTIFAGSETGLWRSSNWGLDWTRVRGEGLNGLGPVHCVLPVGPRVYVGGEGGLYVSEDFGETWAQLYSGGPVLSVRPSRFVMGDPTLFAGTRTGLLKSEDGGRTFHPRLLEEPVTRIEWPGPALVVASGSSVRLSEDAAEHFQPPGRGLSGSGVRSLAVSSFFAIDPVLFVGTASAGVFRSSDGGRSWQSAGLDERPVNDLVWLGPILYAATDGGLWRSDDTGHSWSALGEGLKGRAARHLLFPLAPSSGAEAFLGTDKGVFWTGDGGLQWRPSGLSEESILCLATFPAPDAPQKKRR